MMKAGHNQIEIARILGRHSSTISRELGGCSVSKGYRPMQAQEMFAHRSEGLRNTPRVEPQLMPIAAHFLRPDWSPIQVTSKVLISHETIYRLICADKSQGGTLWHHLRCRKQRKKRYAIGRGRRGQISSRRSIHDRPQCVET